VTARTTNARMCGCSASRSLERYDLWTLEIRPSQVMLMLLNFTFVGLRWRKSCSSVLV